MLSVMEASRNCGTADSFLFTPSQEEFFDVSTWDDIIHVLEHSEESERSTWFLAKRAR